MAKERVKLRVSKGGHNIPPNVIERRYILGIRYLFEYIKIVDRWRVYENDKSPAVKIAEGEREQFENILNFDLWRRLRQL